MRKVLQLIAVLLAGVAPCLAGVSFIAVARGSNQTLGDTVHVLVSGDKARLEFMFSGQQSLPNSEYMLSPDQGKTLYTVSPRTRTYSVFEVQAMLAAMGGMVQGLRGNMKMEFQSPKVEKLLEEDGGAVAGLPTRHYRIRTTYTATTHLRGGRTVNTTTEEDIWTTTQLSDPALSVWLTKTPPSTGDDQFDEIIRAEMQKVPGFPLKRVTVTRTVNGEGQEQITRGEMEVTELKTVDIPDSVFQIPDGYTKVEPRQDEDHQDKQ